MQQSQEPKHAILATVGTDGDIYPFLSLGLALRARGYRVTLATHEHFAQRAREGDLEFHPLVSNAENEQLLVQRDFWHPIKSGLVVARWGAPFIARQYRELKELASRKTIIISNPGVVAARVVQEDLKIPLASVILQPWLIPSVQVPPTMMGGLTPPRWAPRPIVRVYFRLIHHLGARLLGGDLHRIRASLGLKPIRRMFQWWFSPGLIIGMFPAWFGEPQPDWPSQIQLAGFPLNERRQTNGLPQPLAKFCQEHKPVIAFTFGTGMMHAGEIFREAVQACRILGTGGIFLTKFRSQLPAELPPFVHHCEFAPFQDLFPRCAAVVHHGGIGTVVSAFAAGTPQLIFPFAFDQLDNALRVKTLGAGNWLKPNRAKAPAMAAVLAKLILPEATARAQSVATRLHGRSGIERAVEWIETFHCGQPKNLIN